MKLKLTKKDLLLTFIGKENIPLELNHLLKPYGFKTKDYVSKDLLVGHILEEISFLNLYDSVHIFDLMEMAFGLGFLPAGQFLEEGPRIIESFLNQGLPLLEI